VHVKNGDSQQLKEGFEDRERKVGCDANATREVIAQTNRWYRRASRRSEQQCAWEEPGRRVRAKVKHYQLETGQR